MSPMFIFNLGQGRGGNLPTTTTAAAAVKRPENHLGGEFRCMELVALNWTCWYHAVLATHV